MKVVILGDTHFGGGFSLGKVDSHRQINSRLVDFSNTFNYVIDYIAANGISHLIITGDIFEHRRPQASELALFAEKIRRLSELEVYTHIVVGNHDLTFAHGSTTIDVLHELRLPYVRIYADIYTSICKSGDEIINFIFFPFRKRTMLKCKTNDEAVQRLSERLEYEIKGITSGPKILVGHLMLEGTNITPSIMESSLSELVLPISMFNNLDAAIMGHVHPHQIIQQDPLVGYVGSMDRLKFDEGKIKKYFLVVELENNDLTFNFQELPVRQLYDLSTNQSDAVNGEEVFEGIKKAISEFSADHDLVGSIIRLQVFINENSLYGFKTDDIISYLKSEWKINHCVGVFTHVSTKRQLRKESITEHIDPMVAFIDYLDLEDDQNLRQRMKELGTQIISGRTD